MNQAYGAVRSGERRNYQLNVVMVDDTSLYSKKLIEGVSRLGTKCVLYGPLSPLPSKSPRILEKPGPEAVRVWSQNLFPLQILKRAAGDRPDLVHVQFEFYGIHSYGPIYSSLGLPFLLLLLRVARLRTLVTLHSILPLQSPQLSRLRSTFPDATRIPTVLLKTFLILSYKLVELFSDGMLVHARVFKRRLIEQYHVRPSKIFVIPHGVDSYDSSQTRDQQRGELQNHILYFGVMSPRKGIENLLSAFAILTNRRKDCELLLAGSTPPYYYSFETRLKDQARQLGLDQRVHFLGAVSDAEAHHLFEQATFVILPYAYDVSASGVLSWAIGHRVPVIVSDTEYFREELSQCEFGLMVATGGPRPLADAMETLLQRADLQATFSEHARKTGLSRSWNAVAAKTVTYYARIVSQNELDTTPNGTDDAKLVHELE